MDDSGTEQDCLLRARSIGINSGFFDRLLRDNGSSAPTTSTSIATDISIENMWMFFEKLGWHGPRFGKYIDEMIKNVKTFDSATSFHLGIEAIGACLGAETMRPTGQGDPDVIWIFPDTCYTFEAKSEKLNDRLAKKDLLQAKGHVDWLKQHRPDLASRTIKPTIIAPTPGVHSDAAPFTHDLLFIPCASFVVFGEHVAIQARALRVQFSGKDFASEKSVFAAQATLSKLVESALPEYLQLKELTSVALQS